MTYKSSQGTTGGIHVTYSPVDLIRPTLGEVGLPVFLLEIQVARIDLYKFGVSVERQTSA